jgi:hypothetical protein
LLYRPTSGETANTVKNPIDSMVVTRRKSVWKATPATVGK